MQISANKVIYVAIIDEHNSLAPTIYAYSSEAKRQACLLDFVVDRWDSVAGVNRTPIYPPSNPEEAIKVYFDVAGDEEFFSGAHTTLDLAEVTLDGDVPDTYTEPVEG